jgi:hypothetical protein
MSDTTMDAVASILGFPAAPKPVDHADEAELVLSNTPASTYANRPFEAAQAHATLALVEQQRIANLIAYNQAYPMGEAARALRDQIEKGLGL